MSEQLDEQMIRTLIDRVVEVGNTVQETKELIQQIPHSAVVMREIDLRFKKNAADTSSVLASQAALAATVRILTEQVAAFSAKMTSLNAALEKHEQLFEKPLDKTVHYKHYMGGPLLIMTALSFVTLLMTCLFCLEKEKVEEHHEESVKWRAIKNSYDPGLREVVHYIDSASLADPGEFEKRVRYEEERQQALFKTQQSLMKTQQDLDKNREELDKLQKMKKSQ